jgi:hypothetical protein
MAASPGINSDCGMKDERELKFGRPGALHSALLGRLPAHRRGRRSSAPICTVGADAIPSTDPFAHAVTLPSEFDLMLADRDRLAHAVTEDQQAGTEHRLEER